MKILLLLTILYTSVFTQASDFLFVPGSENEFIDKKGDTYKPVGTYFYPGEKWGEMIEKSCADAMYSGDPSIVPDLDTYPIGSFPGNSCKLRRDRDGSIFPMFDKIIINENSTTDNVNAFCDYYDVIAHPSNYGPPIATGSHIGSASFKLSVNWFKNSPTSNGVRFWTTSNVWDTHYWPTGSMTIYTGNAAASIYTFFKTYDIVAFQGRLSVC